MTVCNRIEGSQQLPRMAKIWSVCGSFSRGNLNRNRSVGGGKGDGSYHRSLECCRLLHSNRSLTFEIGLKCLVT